MLPELQNYGKEFTLVMNSGVQFVDFGLKIDWKDKYWREKINGNFIASSVDGSLSRLVENTRGDGFCESHDLIRSVRPDHEINVAQSFKLFDGIWLPIPVLRCIPPEKFDEGPYNWARVRIIELEDGPDLDGNTHRVTFAFDTKVFPSSQDTAYLAPTTEDVRAGALFGLAYLAHHMSWFLDFKWINEWILELFQELAPRLKIHPDDLELEIKNRMYQGHYLNILAILGGELQLPNIKVISNKADDIVKPIPVDMVLDVGNSRTCGILIEEHEQDKDGLKRCYELEIRDLSNPEYIYNEPFESRLEFAQTFFGKEHFSVLSGRRNAFQWATIARVGKEAGRLASCRAGNEGSTGLSSPKRYLWDTASYEQGWRFNTSYVQTDHEPFATAEPLSGLINEFGEALHSLRDEVDEEFARKMPVFTPKYSRSSLMSFMLSEVLMHALMQINSPSQRSKLEHARTPRYLRSVILTIPPALPKPEREIFKHQMHQAVGLVWKSLGWDASDADVDFSNEESRKKYWPELPEIHIQWDEATSGQVVYLFNEVQNNYGGRPEEFIAAMVRPDKEDKSCLTIATVDIGGGTTDLVINDYSLDYGNSNAGSSNANIVPKDRFRDGFKVAGDDILLNVIRDIVVTSLADGLKQAGIDNPESLLAQLIGTEKVTVQNAVLRQQLTLQIFSPIGLRILKEYEEYDQFSAETTLANKTFAGLLEDVEPPTTAVLDYINEPIRRELKNSAFNLLDLPIHVDLNKIHNNFIDKNGYDICTKTFLPLCEVISSYQCDVLLLTGRPSRLPGVQAFFNSRLPLPAGRILPLHNYRVGNWYPFHKQGLIDDPKTTASVGAMICLLSKNLRFANFYFRSTEIKSYSTIKYLGFIDANNVIKDSNVYYKDIDLDNEDYELPDDISFDLKGLMRLGFRQLNAERWTASPLYTLTIESRDLAQRFGAGVAVRVSLGVKNKVRGSNETTENFYIRDCSASDGRSCRKNEDVVLRLNTMMDSGLRETQYWLDSGSIK